MESLVKLMEFQAMAQEKRHKDMILKLDEILKCIPTEVPDNKEDIQALGEIMKTLKFENDPSIPLAIQAMGNAITNEIQSLMASITTTLRFEEKPKEWTFTVKRDSEGFLKEVTAIGK